MATRRGNGEGAIYQRKSDGRWVASLIDNQTGKRKYLYGKTRKEVASRLTVELRNQQQGIPTLDERLTMAKFLDLWLSNSVKPSVKQKTYEGYESICRVRIRPHLGKKALARVSSLDVQGLYTSLQKVGLSNRSIHHTHRVLHRAFVQAMRWGQLVRNPCDGVTPPTPGRHEMQVLDQAQTATLLDSTKEHAMAALYVLAVTTGMRQGELLGLRWSNLDLDESRLTIRRSLQRQRTTGERKTTLAFVEPKTARSRRPIVLSRRAVVALREHRKHQLEARLAAGPDWKDQDLVFAGENGGPLDPSHQTAIFKVALHAAELPAIRFHDLRHTAATLLLIKGIHVKVVSEMLGHASITITLDTYSHLVPALHGLAAAAMDDLLSA